VKNLGTILGAVALVALIPLYIGQFSGKEETSQKTETASTGEAGTTIAYVNFDTLMQNYKYYEDLNQTYTQKTEKVAKQLENRGLTLQNEVVSFQKRAQANLLSQNEFNTIQKNLANKQQDFQTYQQTVSAGLMEEERDLNKKLYDNILAYLQSYNADKKYDVIFNYRQGESIWLAEDALNITQQVLDGLNEEYAATTTEDTASK
jgi:outer membrane protein